MFFKHLKQISILIALQFICEAIVYFLPFSFPANIMAMLLLTVFLIMGVIKEHHIKETADYLLSLMSLFIIPVTISVVQHFETLRQFGLQILLVSLIVMLLAFVACMLTIRLALRFTKKGGGKHAS